MGLFVWYFGVDRRYDDVAHHTILLGPRYRELLDDIFERSGSPPDFSLYLHRPTATDPSLAPQGCDTFYALSPVPNLAGGQDWRIEAEPYRQAIASGARGDPASRASQARSSTSRIATPLEFPGPAQLVPRRRLLARTDPDAERLVPAAQCERGRA